MTTLGIVGGGQLGRMMALAAHPLGVRVVGLDPTPGCPLAQATDRCLVAAYDDPAALAELACLCDVVTVEFENVPPAALEALADSAAIHPSPGLLATCRHRVREKEAIRALGLGTAPFVAVRRPDHLETALATCGLPLILKTCELGYDGKGQRRVETAREAAAAVSELGDDLVAEGLVRFTAELSVIAHRGRDGTVVVSGPFLNQHLDHILDTTVVPAPVDPQVAAAALALGQRLATGLDLVGTLCAELFLLADGGLLVNELAPRPHNSGHLTIEAALVSQFEQHVRAVCGLPLGPSRWRCRAAAMVNLLGQGWVAGEPDWAAALADPAVHVHRYGKAEAAPGRKMGHLTVCGDDPADCARRAEAARAAAFAGRSQQPRRR